MLSHGCVVFFVRCCVRLFVITTPKQRTAHHERVDLATDDKESFWLLDIQIDKREFSIWFVLYESESWIGLHVFTSYILQSFLDAFCFFSCHPGWLSHRMKEKLCIHVVVWLFSFLHLCVLWMCVPPPSCPHVILRILFSAGLSHIGVILKSSLLLTLSTFFPLRPLFTLLLFWPQHHSKISPPLRMALSPSQPSLWTSNSNLNHPLDIRPPLHSWQTMAITLLLVQHEMRKECLKKTRKADQADTICISVNQSHTQESVIHRPELPRKDPQFAKYQDCLRLFSPTFTFSLFSFYTLNHAFKFFNCC